MKTLISILLLLVCAFSLSAQAENPTNIYAAGVSYNAAGSPAVAGTALAAHAINSLGTYSFTVLDAVPYDVHSVQGLTKVTTNIGEGIGQRLLTIGKVRTYGTTTAGVSWNGVNAGWAWTGGLMASVPIGRDGWHAMPHVRFVKSSVNDYAGYQLVLGCLIGWGQ